MALQQVSSLGGLFASIYEDAIFTVRETALMPQLVTNYSATGWMTREVTKHADYPTAQSVDEDQDYSNPVENARTSVTLTPGEIMAQQILTDRVISTDPSGARSDTATWLGQSITNKIESDLLGLFSSLTYGVGVANTALTIDYCAQAVSILRTVSKGQGGPIYVVLHPYQWLDIWNELGTPAATYAYQGDVANEAMRMQFVGNWLGATWFQNSNIAIDTSDDAYGAVFTSECIALDTRKAPVLEWERDASARAWEANFSAGYAYGIRRSEMGVYLLSDATSPAN